MGRILLSQKFNLKGLNLLSLKTIKIFLGIKSSIYVINERY